MKKIKLSQGKYALVDDADFDFLSQWRWQLLKQPHTLYAVRNMPRCGDGKRVKGTTGMHRLILGLNPGDTRQVDHIDGNGLNNQRSNLRIATRTGNMQNRKKFLSYGGKNTKFKFKGVSFERGRFRARARKDGRLHSFGTFLTAKEAAVAYDKGAKRLFGEFANLNFK